MSMASRPLTARQHRRAPAWARGARVTVLALCSIVAACGPAAERPADKTVRVAAAANLRFVMPEILEAFRRVEPSGIVEVTFGATGSFCAQIAKGAPYDLFLAADQESPRRLIAEGLAGDDDVFHYAVGRLALWIPNRSGLDIAGHGLRALAHSDVRSIAVANPSHAPYGSAALAALERAGVLETVRTRLIYGEDIAQAAHFCVAGGADAGILALSVARSSAMLAAGRHVILPTADHPVIRQDGLLLDRPAGQAAAARRFRDFLLGAEAGEALTRFGFSRPNG